jgi:uncharacterized membrane protein YhaH (DUF805 family)
MKLLVSAIRHNLIGLFRFNGRDTPAQFWPYAAAVLACLFVIAAAILLPPIAATGSAGDQSSPARSELLSVQGIIQPLIWLSALAVILFAAAVVRRLHDRGCSGFWALPPLMFMMTGLALMPRLFRNFATAPNPDLKLFFLLFANNLLYLISLLLLLFLLAGAGTSGPNRFGPDAPGH